VAFWGCCFAGLAVVIIPTLWMLIGVVGRALPVFHFSVSAQDLSYDAAFLLIVFLLLPIAAGRLITSVFQTPGSRTT
jgi:hypothetical protein